MTAIRHPYQPDHAVRPGALVQEYLQAMGISGRELARRCGRSAKLITEIILGKAPLEPETALQFERVLGMDATIWLNMEAAYRLHLARAQDERRLEQHASWAQQFPLSELERRRYMGAAKNPADQVRQVIQFFGVGSVEACRERFEEMAEVACRHSPSFASSEQALLIWLRMGEIEAEKKAKEIEFVDYDRNAFIEALREIRKLTVLPIEEAVPENHRAMRAWCGFRDRAAGEPPRPERDFALAQSPEGNDTTNAPSSCERPFLVHILPRSRSPAPSQSEVGLRGWTRLRQCLGRGRSAGECLGDRDSWCQSRPWPLSLLQQAFKTTMSSSSRNASGYIPASWSVSCSTDA